MATNKAKRAKDLRRQQERRHRQSAAAALPEGATSQRTQRDPSSWRQAPAGERRRIEALDEHADLRNKLRRVAELKRHWAGIPMPLEGESLVVEPNYPNAAGLMALCGQPDEPDRNPEGVGATLRNRWHCIQRRCDIVVYTKADGTVSWGWEPAFHHLMMSLRTLNCAEAWGVEQESNAVNLLASLLTHRQFKQYMLAGAFIERSPRSGVHYLFRRLKPTVAIAAMPDGKTKVLAALCLHPIAYYSGSWAGAMCPTDDVIAHLMLMRGDEPMFWRRANQHPSYRPEAGL